MFDWSLLVEILFEFSLPLSIFLATLLIGVVLRKILLTKLEEWAERSVSKLDDIIVGTIKPPFMLWVLILAVYFAFETSKATPDTMQLIGRILIVLAGGSVSWALAKMFGQIVRVYAGKIETAFPVTSLTENITRILILGIGILIVLNSLGISIAPILATLGVGGLAVALALQDTLSNLFAGFHIIITKQIKIGDYLKIETGEEGYVIDINWRTTKIKMLPNNVVLIPNDKLAKAIVVNYYLPDKEMAVLINVGVHYDSDLEKVEKVTCEVAKDVLKTVTGGVPDFDPFIRYHTFADFSINFTVILRAKEFTDQYLIKHEFVKKLHERYRKEGIVIPYPIRTLEYPKDSRHA